MSENYTKGKLYQLSRYPETVHAEQGNLGRRICDTESMGDKGENRANARRIVAAWNACQGISTQALEGAGLPHEAITKLWEAIGWHTQQAAQTADLSPGPKLQAAVDLVGALLTVAQPAEPAAHGASLTDAQIDAVFEQMPEGAQGFLKSWGYRQFARQIADMVPPAAEMPTAPAIAAAVRLLRAAAHELRQSHTTSSDRDNWAGEPDAKAAYDEHMAAAAALEGLCQPPAENPEPSPTAGMSIAQRIAHVGGRDNAAGYIEFGSIQAVEALVRQVLRDMPAAPAAPAGLCKITEPEVERAAVLYVSPGQLGNHTDPDEGEGGRYIPARKTPQGLFTLALYAQPEPAAVLNALMEVRSVLSSINRADVHRVNVGDDLCYWQREEWVTWATKEVLPQIEAVLASQAEEGFSVSNAGTPLAVGPAAEKLGETCMDGGTCHHKESCTETGRCFRRESCVPLTMALDAGLTMQQWRNPAAPAAVAVPDPATDTAEQVEQRERWLEIGKALERACAELPVNAEICVAMERHAGTVTLTDTNGDEHENFRHEDSLAGVINEATDTAIAIAAKAQKGGAA